MTSAPPGRTRFLLFLALAVAAGTALRLWILPGQILLDDEWHGLNQVAGSTLGEVLTDFDAKDNTSLPLNVYHWALLHTAGWSELSVRLPVVAAGVLALALLPLAVRPIVGDRAALFFAFLLAVSPFAVFYSRFARAYAIILLLCFLALVEGCRWLATGETRHRRTFATLGLLGAYTHPLAAIALAAPFGVYAWGRMRGGPRGQQRPGTADTGAPAPPGPAEVRNAGLRIAGLLLPLAWAMVTAKERLPWGQGEWSAQGLRDAATLLSGTVNLPLTLVFYSLLAWGLVALMKSRPLAARAAIVTAAIYALTLAVSRPFGLGTGVVLLRYMIVVLPLSLLAVAAGFDALASRMPPRNGGAFAAALPIAAFALFVALLFVAGPLRAVYAAPNNFTNHSAYQGSYDPPDDARSDARHVYPGFQIGRDRVPGWYATLGGAGVDGGTGGAIIEYPLDITNYNNLFWFYQRVHRRRVLAGYCADGSILGYRAELPPGSGGGTPRLGLLSADQILSHVPDRSKLGFTNMVDVTDPDAVARSGAEYLVLHKAVMALRFLPRGGTDAVPVYYTSVPIIAAGCVRRYGPPVYEDGSIACFRLR